MRNLFLYMCLVMMVGLSGAVKIDTDQINWSQSLPESANITLDQGHVLSANLTDVKNPSSDSDIYVYDAVWGALSVAQWDNGTVIYLGTNETLALDGALEKGGTIYVKDDITLNGYVDVPLNYTHLIFGQDVDITAGANMTTMILVDPVSENKSMYGVSIEGGRFDCASKAQHAIDIRGHYPDDDKLYWGKIADVYVEDSLDSALNINSTRELDVVRFYTRDCQWSVDIEEGCINCRFEGCDSYSDVYGWYIGSDQTHQRSEGIRLTNCQVLGATNQDLYIKYVLLLICTGCIFDYSYGSSVTVPDTSSLSDQLIFSNCYISPAGSTTAGTSGVILRGPTSNVLFSNCVIGNAYYFGMDLGIDCTKIIVDGCTFTGNGRVGTFSGDILSQGADSVTVTDSHLLTSSDGDKFSYCESGGTPTNTIFMGNQYINPIQILASTNVTQHNIDQ